MNLKIISWNCQGLSNPRIVDRILDFLKKKNSNFLCLVETKTSVSRLQHFCVKLNHNWEWTAIPYTGFLGGILVLWK